MHANRFQGRRAAPLSPDQHRRGSKHEQSLETAVLLVLVGMRRNSGTLSTHDYGLWFDHQRI